jgi:hypothetical protein
MNNDKVNELLQWYIQTRDGEGSFDHDLANSKFKVLQFVHVCKTMPSYMSHFESDFDAIIEQVTIDDGDDDDSVEYGYSLYKIKGEKIVNTSAWYEENQLTAIDGDIVKAITMIKQWEERLKTDNDDGETVFHWCPLCGKQLCVNDNKTDIGLRWMK